MEADKIEELFDGQFYFLSSYIITDTLVISCLYIYILGKLKAGDAYMTGKLKIAGNLMKAMKLEKLMKLLKAKY